VSLRSFLGSRSGKDLAVVLTTTAVTFFIVAVADAPERLIDWLHATIEAEQTTYLSNTLTLLVVVATGATVYAFRRWLDLIREIQRRKRAEAEIRVLRGLIPICGFCREICDPQGRWCSLEEYLDKYSEAQLSHGLCPHCARTRFFA
jgi:hypothetical protein